MKIENVFLNNPVWLKPLIRISEETYFCSMPQIFFSFIFPIIHELILSNDELKQRYHDRRAKFLEDEVYFLFKKAFPMSIIHRGYKWSEGNDRYENDLMVEHDSAIILIESKSHEISLSALRGKIPRSRKHIKEIYHKASEQSLRLSDRIKLSIKNPNLKDKLLPNFPTDTSKLKTVLRISVVLCIFHPKSINDSDPNRSVIPI